jgi:hypothetical protein
VARVAAGGRGKAGRGARPPTAREEADQAGAGDRRRSSRAPRERGDREREITPSQARNLERATGARVTDRTGVIVEIFHRHARSREARLQVELARLAYVARVCGKRGGARGSASQGRGAGDTELELDRRRIRDRIAELRDELASIQRERETRRALRQATRSVALVGYTNAGKSSLMRALTGSAVVVGTALRDAGHDGEGAPARNPPGASC